MHHVNTLKHNKLEIFKANSSHLKKWVAQYNPITVHLIDDNLSFPLFSIFWRPIVFLNSMYCEANASFHSFAFIVLSFTEALFLWVFSSGKPFLVKLGLQEIVHYRECRSWFALSNFITARVVCSDKCVASAKKTSSKLVNVWVWFICACQNPYQISLLWSALDV